MAGSAIFAERAIMRIILGMTGGTILRRLFVFFRTVSARMTPLTGNRQVLSSQLEGKFIVSKMLTKAIDPVMTIQTCRAIRLNMTRHEASISLLMTIRTNIDIEDGDICGMTISTDERFFLRLELVRG
jgi:hypothetical protein